MATVLVIGLTGGIASGKSTVAELLTQHGATVLDADALGHEIYEPGLPAWESLKEAFGPQIQNSEGAIDRRKLGALVFNDAAAMRRLTDIVWPLMKVKMRDRLAACATEGVRIAVLEAAVLLEAGWDDLVAEVWVVSVPPETAVQRLTQRSGLREDEAWARLATQLSNEERTARAGLVIENNGSIEELSTRVDALWEGVLERAA